MLMIALFSFLFININTINKLLIQTISLSPTQCLVSKKLRYLTVGQMVPKLSTHKSFADKSPQPRPINKAGVGDS